MQQSVDAKGRIIRHGPYPELTWAALLVGWFLGGLIALSIGYAALILGFSIEGSELAAILGWGILRGLMRRTSIVENNINQTIASAVNGASAGMMFSIPALFILASQDPERFGEVTQFSKVLMVLACITGGVLGLSFVIPLRKQMIDFNRLTFPGGVATASILKAPGAGVRKALLLLGGAVVSGISYSLVMWIVGPSKNFDFGGTIGAPTFLNLIFYLSLMTVGVGFISGRGGLIFGYGGFICYFVLAPLLGSFGGDEVRDMMHPVAAAEARGETLTQEQITQLERGVPETLRIELYRPTGIGMLVGAAIGGIIAAFPLVRSAFRSMQQAAKEKGRSRADAADEMPIGLLYAAVGGGALIMILLADFSVEGMSWWRGALMAILGTLWIWIAGVIVSECLGRTNWSPLSGMTLIAVTILIFISSGMSTTATVVSSLVVGAAVCVAIAQAGDMMLDLKAGYLVGASPKKQQIGQYLATWLGPVLMIFLIFILHEAYEMGSEKLPAPQATALATVINGILGDDVPSWRYAAGAGLGALLAFSGLGGAGVQIGLGFYMPFSIVLTYTVGVLIRMVVERVKGHRFVDDVGIPVSAGLIVGEALVGLGNAAVKIIGGATGGGG